MTTIECKEVCMSFGDQIVLDHISMRFENGHIYGITGRNGSGKTVLLKLICGLMTPTSGMILMNGKPVGASGTMHAEIGALIERPGFLGQYSGYKNLYLLAKLRNKIGKMEIVQTMQTVGLDPTLKKRVASYSLGMKQRLGIAQAVMENPDILILDEPLNAIDSDGVNRIRKLILAQKQAGKLIIVCSHIQSDIDHLADQVVHLQEGKLHEVHASCPVVPHSSGGMAS